MDASESNKVEVKVSTVESCTTCGSVPGSSECRCTIDLVSAVCEACSAGATCPCAQVADQQVKLAASIRKSALDTPFKLGL